MNSPGFYVTGGTVAPDAGSYIARRGDDELYESVRSGEFCYVLTTRQMGKSSLMARTARRLAADGILSAQVDLTLVGADKRSVTPDEWYYGVSHRILRELDLPLPLHEWWRERQLMPPLQRLTELFSDVVLKTCSKEVVIFVDEIDSTIALPFSGDFFAAIRACYNLRASHQEFRRLTFVLLGVATPAQLISDPNRTPFNIGRGVELTDFSAEEAEILRYKLHRTTAVQHVLLNRILYWTGGHPYLTQILCRAVTEDEDGDTEDALGSAERRVDRLVNDIFLSTLASRNENNLKFVRDRLRHRKADHDLLKIYARITEGKDVPDRPASAAYAALKLSGVVKPDEKGVLRVRNRIYQRVFDREWVRRERAPTHLPLLRILLSIVGPILGWLLFRSFVLGHPLKALLLAVIYESLVVLLPAASAVWTFLARPWGDRIARRRYLRHIAYECRPFDMKGLTTQGSFTIDLQGVFVEPSVSADAVRPLIENDLSQFSPVPPTESHDIWEYVYSRRNVVILGSGGIGKTTLLRRLAYVLSTQRGQYVPVSIPILILLRRHGKAIGENPDLLLTEVIRSEDISKELRDSFPERWFERQLKAGKCLILLDGLDEVLNSDLRVRVAHWIDRQFRIYPNCVFIVTSRPFGYRHAQLNGTDVLALKPFNFYQVSEFVYKWYLANETAEGAQDDLEVRREAEKGARDLIHRIQESSILRELAVNPLLLTMIALVHRYRSSLPGRRVELYGEIVDVFIGQRQDAKGIEREIDLTPNQKRRALAPLAYYMMDKKMTRISGSTVDFLLGEVLEQLNARTSVSQFLEAIVSTGGLLLESGDREYAFSHLIFQEYLAASHCWDNKLEHQLCEHVGDQWWSETICLYGAGSDASAIITECLSRTPPELALAAACLSEAKYVDRGVRSRLERLLPESLIKSRAELI